MYIRLHGAQELHASGYDDAARDHWRGAARRDVYVNFDNDRRMRAPFAAERLHIRSLRDERKAA